MVYTEHLLSLWETRTSAHAKQKVSVSSTPSKISGHGVSSELPCMATFPTAGGRGRKHLLCVTPGGDSGKLCLVPPRLHLVHSFLCWFALYPFTVMHPSASCHCVLNPMRAPSKSLNLRLVVGTPTQRVRSECNQILLESTNTRVCSKGHSGVLMVKEN